MVVADTVGEGVDVDMMSRGFGDSIPSNWFFPLPDGYRTFRWQIVLTEVI